MFFGFATNAFAATYYWVGATDGANTSVASNWKTAADACGSGAGNVTVPTTGDTIRFVSNCVNNATVDAALIVSTFSMDAGYTGTTTLNTNATSTTLTVNGGTLDIISGAIMNDTTGNVGAGGAVFVNGAGSTWKNNTILNFYSTGSLSISNGGTMTTGGITQASTGGSINVDGAGSRFTDNGQLYVYNLTLNVTNGGSIITNGVVRFGYGGVGTATAIIDGAGSTWTANGAFHTGYGTTGVVGVITIQNGATMTASNHIGMGDSNDGVNSTGTITVDGVGSTMTATNGIEIGIGGSTGILNVRNGGAVNSGGGGPITIAGGYGTVGTGSVGTINIGSGGAAGTITTSAINRSGAGTATLNFNHTDNIIFSPAITGTFSGGINFLGSGNTANPSVVAAPTFGTIGISSIVINKPTTTGDNATGLYQWQVRRNSATELGFISTTTISVTDSSLLPNTQYTYDTKFSDNAGLTSSYGTQASKYTLAPTPTNLSSTAGLTTMALSVDAFTNPTAGTSGYYFFNSNGNNSGWMQTNSWQDTGLSCSTPYTYSVKYRNGDSTESSLISIAKSTNNCGAVISLGQPIAQAQSQPIIISTSTPPLTVTAEEIAVAPTAPVTPAMPVTPTSYARQWQNILVDAATISSGNLEAILSAVGEVRNIETEANVAVKYTANLTSGLNALSDEVKNIITNFITYGTLTTVKLGLGERAGIINSFKTAFGKAPITETEWRDCIAIGNGRWPNEKNVETETNAEVAFKKVYLRSADRNDLHDNSAVIIIAYGLRPTMRNLNSERAAIRIFMAIYGYTPKSASAWDIVRAIAYSGAKR